MYRLLSISVVLLLTLQRCPTFTKRNGEASGSHFTVCLSYFNNKNTDMSNSVKRKQAATWFDGSSVSEIRYLLYKNAPMRRTLQVIQLFQIITNVISYIQAAFWQKSNIF